MALDTTANRRARVEVLPVSATQHAGETVETRLMTVSRLAKKKSESRPQNDINRRVPDLNRRLRRE